MPLSINKLCQADVSDAGSVIANDVHVRVEDSGVNGLAVLGEKIIKIKSVKVHSFH